MLPGVGTAVAGDPWEARISLFADGQPKAVAAKILPLNILLFALRINDLAPLPMSVSHCLASCNTLSTDGGAHHTIHLWLTPCSHRRWIPGYVHVSFGSV
jgi:hypothetical protein